MKELQREVHQLSKNNGWWVDADVRIVPEKLCLIHSEISEALEEYRFGNINDVYYGENGKPEGLGIELADAVIRTLDLCEYLGLDLEELIKEKHRYNSTRSYRHGGKLC